MYLCGRQWLCWWTFLALIGDSGSVCLSRFLLTEPIYCDVLQPGNGGQLLGALQSLKYKSVWDIECHKLHGDWRRRNSPWLPKCTGLFQSAVCGEICLQVSVGEKFIRSGSDLFQVKSWEYKRRRTDLFTDCGETVQEADCVYDKLIEIGNDSSLLNGGNLKETQIKRFLIYWGQ